MVREVFAVYDIEAQYYKSPFMVRNKGEALRGFTDVVNDVKTELGLHPEQFALFHLGTFDDEKGTYKNNTVPVSLGIGLEFVKKDNVVDFKGSELTKPSVK